MKIGLALFVGLVLSACATQSAYHPPVIDMRGVDQQKYADDLAECTEKKKAMGWVTPGGVISDCLGQKGYKVLERLS